MRKTSIIIMALLLIMACSKNDKLPSRTDLLTGGKWEMIMAGTNAPDTTRTQFLVFERNGDFALQVTGQGSSQQQEGKWKWSNAQETQLKIKLVANTDSSTLAVTRLTSSLLQVKENTVLYTLIR